MARKFAKVAKPSAQLSNKVVETTMYPFIRFNPFSPSNTPRRVKRIETTTNGAKVREIRETQRSTIE
jgi:hypothetical protein